MVGPARRSPAKKSAIAATVAMPARQTIQPQPAGVSSPGRSWPLAAEPGRSVAAAPVQTSADSGSGPVRATVPSLIRMYAL